MGRRGPRPSRGRPLADRVSGRGALAGPYHRLVVGEAPGDSRTARGAPRIPDATEVRSTLDAHPEWRTGLRADLQMHTTHSDGSVGVREMVEACSGIGHEHVAITDHSKGLKIARGMDEARLARQGREIDLLNEELGAAGVGIRALRAIEMNLSPGGEGDMDPWLWPRSILS